MPSVTEVRRPAQIGNLITKSRGQPDGIVIVFGTGVNIQASLIEKQGPDDDWAGLLGRIAAEIGLTEQERGRLPSSFLSRWECLLTGLACARGIEPFQAENYLQMRIVKGLRIIEQRTHAYTLYKEIAASGLSDLISLNFDRRTALALDSGKFISGPDKPDQGPSAQTLYRHDLIAHGNFVTRIWYPHGDTRRADTLKLGVRRYGFHLGLLREYFGYSAEDWRVFVPWKEASDEEDEPLVDDENEKPNHPCWVTAFLGRPLLFVGCGLGADEWSLWWLLRYRSRQHEFHQPTLFTWGIPPQTWFHLDQQLDYNLCPSGLMMKCGGS